MVTLTASSTGAPSAAGASFAAISARGFVQSRWYMAPTSRAKPATERQSGRFGVISRSSTVSESFA